MADEDVGVPGGGGSRLFLSAGPTSFGRAGGGPVGSDFAPEEFGAAGELVQSIDAVFNADPRIKADSIEFSKDGIVIV